MSFVHTAPWLTILCANSALLTLPPPVLFYLILIAICLFHLFGILPPHLPPVSPTEQGFPPGT